MRPLVTWADAERIAVDYLDSVLPTRPESYTAGATAGVSLPKDWAPSDSAPFVVVALDGTPMVDYPVRSNATVRCTAYGLSTTDTKALAALVQGLLITRPGDSRCSAIQALTGVLPARDRDSGAALASITVRMILRPQVL